MSIAVRNLSMLLEKEKDPLEINVDIQIKQEIEDLDDFEVSASINNGNDKILTRQEFNNNSGSDNLVHEFFSSGERNFENINNLTAIKKNVIKILPLNKKDQIIKDTTGLDNKTVEIKQENPCDCMQNIEYYCSKCKKSLLYINEVKQCSVCHNQLKLQCKLCQKRYKLLNSIEPTNISANIIKKELNIEEGNVPSLTANYVEKLHDDHMDEYNHEDVASKISQIKDEVLYCYKCKFSTKVKEQLNRHILKTHWQPKAEVLNSDDDIYIELSCKSCQKICRKVVYDDRVKLVCRECKVPMTYRCTLCCTGYKLLKNVRSHIKLACPYRTNNEKFFCAECPFKTEIKTKLENHIMKKHIKQKCSNCYQVLENKDALKEHELKDCPAMKSNIHPVKLKLPVQNELTKDENFVILQHSADELIKSLKGKPPKDTKEWGNLVDYSCLECGDEAKKKFARFRPWCRKCNLKYEYRCTSCGKLYQNFDRIQHHVKLACPSRMLFECPVCGFSVSNKNLLHGHIQAKHTVYKCMICFRNVEGLPALIKHQTSDCYKDYPSTVEELEQLITMYCKHCHEIPKRTLHGATAKCSKCTGILSHQCLKCLSLFDSQKIAFKHVKKFCKPKFSCTKCSFKTYNREGLNMHVKYNHLNRMCPDCGVCFRDELIFQLHRNEEIRKKREKLGVVPTMNAKRLKTS